VLFAISAHLSIDRALLVRAQVLDPPDDLA
jgi:hypothetical protein